MKGVVVWPICPTIGITGVGGPKVAQSTFRALFRLYIVNLGEEGT